MRKSTLVFIVFSLLSLAALASSRSFSSGGDLIRPSQVELKEFRPPLYFSLFSFFSEKPGGAIAAPDTIRIVVPYPRIKEDTRKPK
jgi:hypothetical protein